MSHKAIGQWSEKNFYNETVSQYLINKSIISVMVVSCRVLFTPFEHDHKVSFSAGYGSRSSHMIRFEVLIGCKNSFRVDQL